MKITGRRFQLLTAALCFFALWNLKSQTLMTLPPSLKTVEAGSFPTLAFRLMNQHHETLPLQVTAVLPAGWQQLSLRSPEQLLPQQPDRVRLTLAVPITARALRTYKIGLACHAGTETDTVWALMRVKRRRAIALLSYEEELQVKPGEVVEQSYTFENTGNARDTLQFIGRLPQDWKPLSDTHYRVLMPGERATVTLKYRVPSGLGGNAVATVIMQARVPKAKRQPLMLRQYEEDLFQPKEKAILDFLVQASDKARQNKERFLTLTQSDQISAQSDRLMARTRVRTAPVQEEANRALHPLVPVHLGLRLTGLESDRRPDWALDVRSGRIDLGRWQGAFEYTERFMGGDLGSEQDHVTDRIRLALEAGLNRVVLGDALVRSNTLLNERSGLVQGDLEAIGDMGRGAMLQAASGGWLGQAFYGRSPTSDSLMAYVHSRLEAGETWSYGLSALRRGSVYLASLEGTQKGSDRFSLTYRGGLSRYADVTGLAFQTESAWQSHENYVKGRLHWAQDEFYGVDGGRSGVVASARYIPSEGLYHWANFRAISNGVIRQTEDKTTSLTELRTRSVLQQKNGSMLHLGGALRSINFKDGLSSLEKDLLVYWQQNWPGVGYVAMRGDVENSWDAFLKDNETQVQLKSVFQYYGNFIRLKAEERWQILGQSPGAWVTGLDLSIGVGPVLVGGFLTTGHVYTRVGPDYVRNRLFTAGVRSHFNISPFGRDYQFRLEAGRYSSEWEDFKRDWRVALSFSAGSRPRFTLPLPFVKTKGRLQGELFIDENGDGIRGVSEKGVSQAVIFVGGETTLTDGNGFFESDAMEPGDIPFRVDWTSVPSYLKPSKTPPNSVTLWRGAVVDLQIPLVPTSAITGRVYLDENKNGAIDAGEAPLPKVKVLCTNASGHAVETYTRQDGSYILPELAPGYYVMTIDAAWLPPRTQTARTAWAVSIDSKRSSAQMDLPVQRRTLTIKKTFTEK